jgi:hypothetical protein
MSIPLIGDGRIVEDTAVKGRKVYAISLIVGLDKTTADTKKPHPVDVIVRLPNGHSLPLHQDDIVDNKFTRFNLTAPAEFDTGPGNLHVEVVNKSANDQIGVYVKVPDGADRFAELSGITVRGHAGQVAPYARPDLTLSGCIAGEAS